MFSSWTLILAIKAAKALVLPSPQVPAQDNATTDTSLEAVSVDPVWQTNTSINSLNVSTDVYYYCDTKFGIGINSESCYRAITRVPDYTSTVQRTFGTRGTGVHYDFTLPKWFISRAYTLIKYGSVSHAELLSSGRNVYSPSTNTSLPHLRQRKFHTTVPWSGQCHKSLCRRK